MQLLKQKDQLEAKISENKSINEANSQKLREEIEEDGKHSLQSVKQTYIYNAFFQENNFKKLKNISSRRICSIAQLEDLESSIDEMDEAELRDMAETFFDDSSYEMFQC